MNKNCIKIFLILIFSLKLSSCNFSPGSYPYAQEYEINVNESILIKAVEDFKKSNPLYIVPNYLQIKDGRYTEKDHWYHNYFYYPDEIQIINAWLRSSDKGHTTLAFVGINQGLTLGHWKEINKDFNNSENQLQKQKFEERILRKIKEKL